MNLVSQRMSRVILAMVMLVALAVQIGPAMADSQDDGRVGEESGGESLLSDPYHNIRAYKFEDRNGDGVRDAEEGPLEGWEFELWQYDPQAGPPWREVDTQITGIDGYANFGTWPEYVPGGGSYPYSYRITETVKVGWTCTTPAGGQAKIYPLEEDTTKEFGNYRECASPTADFSASPITGCTPLAVNFTDLSSGDYSNWSWDFGDGGTGDSQNPTHEYTQPGIYTVALTVSGDCGSATETKAGYITVYANPTASATSNSPVYEGETIDLTGGPDNMNSYSWTGPNGYTSSEQSPNITNASTSDAGQYCLTVVDENGCEDEACTTVTVYENPTVRIDAPDEVGEGVTGLVVPVEVNCISDFDAAQFDVSYDPDVLSVTDVTTGTIGEAPIPVGLWSFVPVSTTQGTARIVVNVDDYPGVSGSGYLAEIHFDVFGAPGVTSTVGLSNGTLSDKDAQEISATWVGDVVTITSGLEAGFSVSPTEGYVNDTEFSFTDESSGGTACGTPPYTYKWDFGDESAEITDQDPSHIYTSAGTYTVTLTITDCLPGGGATNTVTMTDCVTVHESLDATCSRSPDKGTANCTTFSFTNTTTTGKMPYACEWDFGDGKSSTICDATHTYTSAGTFTPTLTVTDTLGTVDTQDCRPVEVYKLGDANEDGEVKANDITKVERIILNWDDSTPGADANCDTDVNALDITKVELIIMTP